MKIGKEEEPVEVPEPGIPDTVPEEMPEERPAEPAEPQEPVPVGPTEE